MKEINITNIRKARQAGFTIIELVVVILLLGILTATALPRFMDVTDEAHGAVVDAVRGGLLTGAALFRAQYVAEGENRGAAVGYGSGLVFSDDDNAGDGYPAGIDDDGITADAVDCLAIYDGLLQTGRPSSAGVAAPISDAATETAVETAGADFVAAPDNAATPTGCIFYYTGQFSSGDASNPVTIRTIEYTVADGDVVEGSHILNLDP